MPFDDSGTRGDQVLSELPGRQKRMEEERSRLVRMLSGVRLRVRSRTWVITSVDLTASYLSVSVSDVATPIVLDLPATFNPDSAEHIAWVFFNLEQALNSYTNGN